MEKFAVFLSVPLQGFVFSVVTRACLRGERVILTHFPGNRVILQVRLTRLPGLTF